MSELLEHLANCPASSGLPCNCKDYSSKSTRASNWISVEDRLPEYGTPILCYYPTLHEQLRFKVAQRLYCNLFIGLKDDKDRPTHWQPLPEPPEE